MIILAYLFFIFTISIYSKCDAFNYSDCMYDDSTDSVEYICGGSIGNNFAQRTTDFIYCGNYPSGIYRRLVKRVNLHSENGCTSSVSDEVTLNLYPRISKLDISFTGMYILDCDSFKDKKFLEQIIASHNEFDHLLSCLFENTPELTAMDFSHNFLIEIPPELFNNTYKLKSINVSFNKISTLDVNQFNNLRDLEYLDISNNSIHRFNSELFVHNKHLTNLNFNNNSLDSLECALLSTLTDLNSLKISLNTLLEFKSVCDLPDEKRIKLNFKISSNDSTSVLRISNNRFEWTFNNDDFKKLRYLDFSNGRIEKTSIFEHLNTEIESLDLSNLYVSELSETALSKFVQLRKLSLHNFRWINRFDFEISCSHSNNVSSILPYYSKQIDELDLSNTFVGGFGKHIFDSFGHLSKLNLSRTNLTNFQLDTFDRYSLVELDISHNNLEIIDSVIHPHFPHLERLSISGNRLSCDYLTQFAQKWHVLSYFHHGLWEKHIDKTDCVERNSTGTVEIDDHQNQTESKNRAEINEIDVHQHIHQIQNELFTVKILLAIFSILGVVSIAFIANKYLKLLNRLRTVLLHQNPENHSAEYCNDNIAAVAIHLQPESINHLDCSEEK